MSDTNQNLTYQLPDTASVFNIKSNVNRFLQDLSDFEIFNNIKNDLFSKFDNGGNLAYWTTSGITGTYNNTTKTYDAQFSPLAFVLQDVTDFIKPDTEYTIILYSYTNISGIKVKIAATSPYQIINLNDSLEVNSASTTVSAGTSLHKHIINFKTNPSVSGNFRIYIENTSNTSTVQCKLQSICLYKGLIEVGNIKSSDGSTRAIDISTDPSFTGLPSSADNVEYALKSLKDSLTSGTAKIVNKQVTLADISNANKVNTVYPYILGGDTLSVFYNQGRMTYGIDYIETNNSEVQFLFTINENDYVTFVIDTTVGSVVNISHATSADMVPATGIVGPIFANTANFATSADMVDGYHWSTGSSATGIKEYVDTKIVYSVPAGSVMFYAASSPPEGWIVANGATISRSNFNELFSAIGTTFGPGDGVNTFKIPDLRGEFIRGYDNGRGVDSSRVFGSFQSTSTGEHRHFLVANTDGSGITLTSSNYVAHWASLGHSNGYYLDGSSTEANIGLSSNNGENISTETRPRNIALLPCIKY